MNTRIAALLAWPALLAVAPPTWAQAPADTGSNSTPAAVPVRDFARFSSYQQLVLSPDGKHFAASLRDKDGVYSLLTFELPGKKPVGGLKLSRDRVVGNVAWVSNQRLLISLAVQEEVDDAPAFTGELFAMNLDGTNKKYLFGRNGASQIGTKIKSGNESKDGFARLVDPLVLEPDYALITVDDSLQHTADGRYYGSSFVPLFRINVNTGRLSRVADAPIRSVSFYVADSRGRARLVYGRGEDSPDPVAYWKSDDSEWQRVPIQGQALAPVSLSEDGQRAYFTVERGEQRCLMAMPIPLASASAIQQLICKPLNEMREFYTNEGIPYGYSATETSQIQLLGDEAPLKARVLASLRAQFQDQKVLLHSASRDGRQLLFLAYSDRIPGDFFLYNDDNKEAGFLDSARPWVDPARMAEVRQLSYAARDGLMIEAFLTLPAGRVAKQLPLVVMPHGGPIGITDDWYWDADAQFLASRGYAVLQMNYRGSGGRGEAFERKGYREWGGKIIDDITDGARWAVDKGYADPKRLCIFGGSYGGYAALMSAVREPDLYRCAVGYVGVYDLNLLLTDSDGINKESGKLFWQESIGATPEARALQSPIHYLDQLKAAVMIVHGERDIRTPYSQAKALRSALEKRGKAFEWLVKDNEGHGFADEDNRIELYEKLAAFLDRHIGPAR